MIPKYSESLVAKFIEKTFTKSVNSEKTEVEVSLTLKKIIWVYQKKQISKLRSELTKKIYKLQKSDYLDQKLQL